MREFQGRMAYMNYRVKYCCRGFGLILKLLLVNICFSQDLYYEQFTEVDGLPSLMTYEMVQNSNGILWIGTENGLVSYDGEEFITYMHPDLKDNDIIAISLSYDGSILFFNISNQLGRVVDGEVEIVLEGKGIINDYPPNHYLFHKSIFFSPKVLEFMNLYLDLEKLRFKDKVNIHVVIDPEVDSLKDVIHVPPLLIQPVVENSFKHGLFHKKSFGNLLIQYTLINDILQVIIQDDGIGREMSNKISRKNTEKQTSSGIKTTIERIELLNFGKSKKLNSVEIEDLYDVNGNAAGTKTILNLAIENMSSE